MNHPKAVHWKKHLKMKPHPEGGNYTEIFRSEVELKGGGETRNLATSIYFLLEGSEKSHWHQLASDELWYFHEGASVNLHMFFEGEYIQKKLGMDEGCDPQLVIPAGAVFAATCSDANSYCLMSCVVTPGFDFKDFRLVSAAELLEIFPEEEQLISAFAS